MLAAQLRAFGASVRIIDRALDRVHESRALAVQPRTLEALRGLGLAEELIARGNPTVHLRIHTGTRVAKAQLFDIGLDDTAFPFLLFVSQAETEVVLGDHLSGHGITVERGVGLTTFEASPGGLVCTLRHRDGAVMSLRARYLAGCDGAHSTVRDQAGIPFVGARYPQTFLLADLDVDGLEPGTVNAFVTDWGPLFFFPLGQPAPWRLLTMRPATARPDDLNGAASATGPVTLAELTSLTDEATRGRLRLSDPVWATAFSLHHRHATSYRSGRVFLAGDAAHIHSPAGAQGMNTGIQDAWNLGWKLALVCRGLAPDSLLDSYDAERRPVGQFVLRFTDRAFTAATSINPVLRLVRSHVAPRVLPWALRFRAGRAAAFRTVSQLGIRYTHSPAIERRSPPGRRPRAGDRLPDAQVTRDATPLWLHQALTAPGFHLLLCGSPDAFDTTAIETLQARHGALVTIHWLDRRPGPGVLHDRDGRALARLRVRGHAHLLVRPDGHIGYRADDHDLAGVERHLAHLLSGTSTS